jgi:peptidoglycan/xylan/chitin deacetylase (PgdA/CDA1 family)/glycosyltransferase involved in cell wall biosynthesis
MPMNILFTLSQLEVTGPEAYAVELADWLIARGHIVFIFSDTLTLATKAEYHPLQFNKRNYINRIGQIVRLVLFIGKNNIQVIHSHSRASMWISHFACRVTGIPHISTVHGRQPVHPSRKLIPAFGDYCIAVCEAIKEHLANDLSRDTTSIELLRNPISLDGHETHKRERFPSSPIVIIGRFSGPKGDMIYNLLSRLSDDTSIQSPIIVVGGKEIPERFDRFRSRVEFTGFVKDIERYIAKAAVVVGSGRVAAESIMMSTPTVAIGEACSIGLITEATLTLGLSTNFGDIAEHESFQWDRVIAEIKNAITIRQSEPSLAERVKSEFDPEKIHKRILQIYEHQYVHKRRYEIPVLCYHGLVSDDKQHENCGIHVPVFLFRQHMAYLLRKGYTPITFRDLENINRLDRSKRYVILSFDDGYENNYTLLYPILKEFGYTCTIFLVAGAVTNTWDQTSETSIAVPLLKDKQIREMSSYGIEFGAHSCSHPHLTHLSPEQAKKEIVDSKKLLVETFGMPFETFAYPYGDVNEEIAGMVADAGFKYGIATDSGPLALSDYLYHIRRIIIFPHTSTSALGRKVNGSYTFKQVKRDRKRRKKNEKLDLTRREQITDKGF